MNRGMTINGISYYLPEMTLDNDQLVADFGTWTPEKIIKKTGVKIRHIADHALPVSHFLIKGGEKFFEEHPQIARDSIDMLVVCSETRDYILPSTACIVHEGLKLRKTCGAMSYDLGCSGYLYGLGICHGFISAGIAKRVLLITGDQVTRYINKRDKSIRTIFGDGFAATLLDCTEADNVRGFDFGTDGSGKDDIIIEAGETAMPLSPETAVEEVNRYGNAHSKENLFMAGRKVLDFSLDVVPGSLTRSLEEAGLKFSDIDLFVFHQASRILLETVRDALQLDPDKFVIDMSETGNTASSTIPIALKRCFNEGRLKKGMKILSSGFGVGLSWGSAVIEWNGEI